jgi:hypothetical protein
MTDEAAAWDVLYRAQREGRLATSGPDAIWTAH